MRYQTPPSSPSKRIEQTWTDAVREQRRRGSTAEGVIRDPSSGPYTVLMVSANGLPWVLFG